MKLAIIGFRDALLAKFGLAFAFSMLVSLSVVSPVYAAGGFSFSQSSGNYKVGDTISVSVRVDTGSSPTNAVSANFTYPTNLLEYLSADATGSDFSISAVEKVNNGTVSFDRGSYTPLTGDKLVQKANFKVLATGTATLNFTSDSIAVSSQDNSTNVATGRGSASYTLEAADQTVSPPSTPKPETVVTPKQLVTRITPVTPQGTAAPISLTDNDVIQVETPFDVQPYTIQPDGVSKIEYYLNNKLVKTVNIAPYKYRVDTSKLLNGKYKLTTKTYYSNGQTSSVSQTLIVHNAYGVQQLKLWLRKYIGLIVLLFVLVVGAVAVWVIRRGHHDQGGPTPPTYTMSEPASHDDRYSSSPETVTVPTKENIRY